MDDGDNDNNKPTIKKQGVDKMIQDVRERMKMGFDQIPSETLKAMGSGIVLKLTSLINTGENVLRTSMIPKQKKQAIHRRLWK